MSRRAFIGNGSRFLLADSATKLVSVEDRVRKVRVGLVTNLHQAEKPNAASELKGLGDPFGVWGDVDALA